VAESRRILAIGGGRSDELYLHALTLVEASRPRVLWVGTAGAEDPAAALRVHELFSGRADVTRLAFFPWPPPDLRRVALEHNLILVGGGNTANMLAVWRRHGFDEALREAWHAGVLLAGSSAGMVCWFEAGVTDSFGPQLGPLEDGLGFLPGSCCPHWDDEELRRPVYRRLVDAGFPAGYGVDHGVGLLFAGTDLVEVVTPREGATAYRVESGSEVRLPARLLS
jgi:peptidase E